ncbi:MAG: undecaprenyl-diphosphate phosphatase [Firmicutes bacterium]|nr:undecaprenyl-diphosphate phosphatase [Bacillota bacterium]
MTLFQGIFMGIIQGLTEFLPVSSSGHLAISRYIFRLHFDNILFEVLLHIGTLIAIITVYYKDVLSMVLNGIKIIKNASFYLYTKFIINFILNKKEELPKIIVTNEERFVMLIIIGSIPTAIIGLLLEKIIILSFDMILVPGICLIITGGLLSYTRKIKFGFKKEKDISYFDAITIGVFQGLAALPGISRSGSTIVAGLIKGLDRELAVKFSLLMSLPAVFGAMLLQFKDIPLSSISSIITPPYIIGTLFSAIVGYICIKFLLKLIRRNKLYYFGYYCLILGTIVIITYFINI